MRKSVLAGFIVLAGFTMLGVGSAANMGVTDETILTGQSSLGCDDTVEASLAQDGTLTLSGINAGCASKPITVRVLSGSQQAQQTLNGTTSAPVTTFHLAASPELVSGVLVAVNGWQMSVSWTGYTPEGPIVVDPGTPQVDYQVIWNQMAATQFCADIIVTSPSASPVPWRLLMNLDQEPFNGVSIVDGFYFSYGSGLYSSTIVDGQLSVTGSLSSTSTVYVGHSQHFTVCNWHVPPPAISDDPAIEYFFSETTVVPSWWVCKDVTVTVTGAQFYVGWEAIVDTEDLRLAYLGGKKGRLRDVGGDFDTTKLGGDMVKVTGNGWNTWGVRPDHPVTFTICYG